MAPLINPLYLGVEVQQHMRGYFASQKPRRLLLPDFFTKKQYGVLLKQLATQKGALRHEAERFSFQELVLPQELKLFLTSAQFKGFLSTVLNKPVRKIALSARRFEHASYTLLHDNVPAGQASFFIIFGNGWDSSWGGSTVYFGGGEPLIFAPVLNSFSLVHPGKDMRAFVKYVTHFVGKKSFVKVEGILS